MSQYILYHLIQGGTEVMTSIGIVQEEYPKEYCDILEIAYGKGFLSEGGTEAVDSLVSGFELEDQKILEIGSGLGGAAFHIAEKYNTSVTGIEINQAMVDEANCRIPLSLKNKTKFVYYNDINHLPFANESFDFAYSKGVFLHVSLEEKLTLFREIYRVLKPESFFLINDWLSPINDIWGGKNEGNV